MSTTQSYGRWFVNYALLCATLLFAGHVTGEVSQWAGSVFGAADCDSYGYMAEGPFCPDKTGNTCTQSYNKCETEGKGLKKWLCQPGKGVQVCGNQKCAAINQDKKTNQCNPAK